MKIVMALILAILPCAIKLPLYRLLGFKIGNGTRIGFGTVILCDQIEINDGAQIGHFCIIRAKYLAMGKRSQIMNLVRIGVNTLIMRSQATICSQNQIAGYQNDSRSKLTLGTASWILPHCYINVARSISLGKNVGVGGGSYLFTHGVWLSKLDGFPVAHGGIAIEDDVWLPWGCFIMPNVTIGSRAIVGACSVVTKSLPPGVLAAGVPAKIIREKSNTDLNPVQRAAIIVEITEAFGVKKNVDIRVESTQTVDRHYISDKLVLLLHKQEGEPLAPNPTLNIMYGEIDRQQSNSFAQWSLKDYTSSPYLAISKEGKAWLEEARSVGVRYYPIDEDLT